VWMDDRRKERLHEEADARVTKSHARPELKHSICRTCLKPVRFRMTDEPASESMWEAVEIGTGVAHECRVNHELHRSVE